MANLTLILTDDNYPIANLELRVHIDSLTIGYVTTPIKEDDMFPSLATEFKVKLGIRKSREQLAQHLAKELTAKIIELFESKDLVNGYTKDELKNLRGDHGKQH